MSSVDHLVAVEDPVCGRFLVKVSRFDLARSTHQLARAREDLARRDRMLVSKKVDLTVVSCWVAQDRAEGCGHIVDMDP